MSSLLLDNKHICQSDRFEKIFPISKVDLVEWRECDLDTSVWGGADLGEEELGLQVAGGGRLPHIGQAVEQWSGGRGRQALAGAGGVAGPLQAPGAGAASLGRPEEPPASIEAWAPADGGSWPGPGRQHTTRAPPCSRRRPRCTLGDPSPHPPTPWT